MTGWSARLLEVFPCRNFPRSVCYFLVAYNTCDDISDLKITSKCCLTYLFCKRNSYIWNLMLPTVKSKLMVIYQIFYIFFFKVYFPPIYCFSFFKTNCLIVCLFRGLNENKLIGLIH